MLESAADWRRVRIDLDCYEGWVHAGYCVEVDDARAEAWRQEATGWSLGAVVRLGEGRRSDSRSAPGWRSRARRSACPTAAAGRWPRAPSPARPMRCRPRAPRPPERWALEYFAGSPYQWGGVTPGGVDCSGLVQTTFLARGLTLPRDSSEQARCGTLVALDDIRPGDLLFFREGSGERVTHVAFAGEADTLVHSTIALGGMVQEPWLPGSRAASLRERLVAVRRLEER